MPLKRPNQPTRYAFASLVVAFATLGLETSAATAQVATLAKGFGELRILPTPLEDPPTRYGNLSLELAQTPSYPITAGNTIVGFFHPKGGRFTYRAVHSNSFTHFRHNTRRSTSASVEDGVLSEKAAALLIFDASVASPLDNATPVDPEAVSSLQKDLDRHLERFSRDLASACRLLVMKAIVEARPQDASCVEIQGPNDYVHSVDRIDLHEEVLSVLERYPSAGAFAGRRQDSTLHEQSTTDSELESRPKRWFLRHVDLDLFNPYDARMELSVRQAISFYQPTRIVDLRLSAFIYDNVDLRAITIESVTTKEGNRLAYARRGHNLLVELPREYQPGEMAQLAFQLSGDVLYRPSGHSFWWLFGSRWFPLPERLDMRNFTYRATVKVPAPFRPFSMGRTLRRWQENGFEAAEFELDRPVQLAVVLAGRYNSYSETRDGLTINLSSYAFKRTDSMKKIAHNTFELIAFYEKLLGPFPFAELDILEINSFGVGIAPPGVIYLTREAFDPGPVGRRFRAELNHRMAHEVAHQWWGHVAQMESLREQWLSESTAEYYSALAIRHLLGEHKHKAAIRTWRSDAGALKGLSSIYYANTITGDLRFIERFGLLYAKGPLMLQELHSELGDQQFLTLFKSLLTSFPYQPINTDKVIRLTNHITGQDWRPWFEKRLFAAD